MRKTLVTLVCTATLALPALSMADEKIEHYEGKKVESLSEALTYFKSYNQKFAEILKGDLDAQAMAEIHQMSYTMENALGRLNSEMDQLAATLEAVHLASESADQETVKTKGREYLDVSRQIVGGEE